MTKKVNTTKGKTVSRKSVRPELPKRIQVGPLGWQIEEVGKEYYGNSTTMASCSSVKNHYIKINTALPNWEEEAVDSMLHELIHAMDDTYRIGLSEKKVHLLAEALAHLIEYNPQLIYWIEKHSNYLENKE